MIHSQQKRRHIFLIRTQQVMLELKPSKSFLRPIFRSTFRQAQPTRLQIRIEVFRRQRLLARATIPPSLPLIFHLLPFRHFNARALRSFIRSSARHHQRVQRQRLSLLALSLRVRRPRQAAPAACPARPFAHRRFIPIHHRRRRREFHHHLLHRHRALVLAFLASRAVFARHRSQLSPTGGGRRSGRATRRFAASLGASRRVGRRSTNRPRPRARASARARREVDARRAVSRSRRGLGKKSAAGDGI